MLEFPKSYDQDRKMQVGFEKNAIFSIWPFKNLKIEKNAPKGWVTNLFSYALRHNDGNKMTPPPPAVCIIPRFSTKLIVFENLF